MLISNQQSVYSQKQQYSIFIIAEGGFDCETNMMVLGATRGQHDARKYVRMGAFDEGSTWNQIVHEYYIIIHGRT